MMLRVIAVMLFALSASALGGESHVIEVVAHKGSSGYRFDVTVQHADTGWDHYADKWDVLDPSGKVLGTRVLYHPHVDEQPFTRSLSGVAIPPGIEWVELRAHDKVHGYGGKTIKVQVNQ